MAGNDYLIVEPSPTIIPLPEQTWSPALVDYSVHPAYRDLVARPSAGDRAAGLAIFLKSMAVLLVKRLVRYEMIPNDVRSDATAGGRLKMVGHALGNMVSRPRERAVRVQQADQTTGRLGRDGIHVVSVPDADFQALAAAAEPQFDELNRRRAQGAAGKRAFDDSRGRTTRKEQQALFEVIERVLKDAGVMDVASAYMQRPGRVIDVNPQINDTSDTFWKDIFPDTPPSDLPGAAYCHRDASGGDLKAIIYMTDVEPRNGPFSYVVGSHRMHIPRLDDLICEANDSNGLAGTDARSRARFAALPGKFMQKGSFGNDLLPTAPLAQDIARGLWAISARKGSIVLFDTKGIHRGGMVESGERRVITCVIG
ncbi:phytanoyl-CoA dioxygenase family protein [Brevundimonas sp.]|uniref:phytanoyl-CoA dioxygenase family protein n=1 Tax=Brevundimonas sp. TaxID=1871086 RepID=UPI0025C15B5F|nr:phytanoyl-CoA dioxygenase family protein [Brevundimonas sp.]